jgi:hypothetical protein
MVKYYSTNLIVALGGVALAFAIVLGLATLQMLLLREKVTPPAGTDIQIWLDEFKMCQDTVITIAAALAFIWHVIALVSKSITIDHRWFWLILWCACAVAAGTLSFTLLLDAQSGSLWAHPFGFVNGILTYWLGTVWNTPATNKYAPLGAMTVRRAF